MLMKQRCVSSWQGTRMYRSAQYLLGAHECLWCALHFIPCLQTEFSCLSKVFTNLDAKQTTVEPNKKNLNYSGTQVILWSLSFSLPPPQCRGFNPVACQGDASALPQAAGSSPGPGGPETRGRTAQPGRARRRLPRLPSGGLRCRAPRWCLGMAEPAVQRRRSILRSSPRGWAYPKGRIFPVRGGSAPPPRASACAGEER